jgi:hypothetical protein
MLRLSIEFEGPINEAVKKLEQRRTAVSAKGAKARPKQGRALQSAHITYSGASGTGLLATELPDELKERLRAWVDEQVAAKQ